MQSILSAVLALASTLFLIHSCSGRNVKTAFVEVMNILLLIFFCNVLYMLTLLITLTNVKLINTIYKLRRTFECEPGERFIIQHSPAAPQTNVWRQREITLSMTSQEVNIGLHDGCVLSRFGRADDVDMMIEDTRRKGYFCFGIIKHDMALYVGIHLELFPK